jgi:hypothetical protein
VCCGCKVKSNRISDVPSPLAELSSSLPLIRPYCSLYPANWNYREGETYFRIFTYKCACSEFWTGMYSECAVKVVERHPVPTGFTALCKPVVALKMVSCWLRNTIPHNFYETFISYHIDVFRSTFIIQICPYLSGS